MISKIGILLLLMVIGYWIAQRFTKYLPQPYQGWLSKTNFHFKTVTANVIDAFYPQTYLFIHSAIKLPTLNLDISQTDLKRLEDDAHLSVKKGYTSKNETSTQSIKIVFENKSYSATISFHGGGANDFVFKKSDYNVKIKDNLSVAGYASFNLFNPSVHRWILPLLAESVADKLDLIVDDQIPVLVKINQKTLGIYLLEEKINEDFLIKRGWKKAAVIKRRDETRLPHRLNPIALNAHILSGFDWEIANVDPLKDDEAATLGHLDRFYKAVKNKDYKTIATMIDLDYWARYDAYRQVLGINHDAVGSNLIMIFQPDTKLFFPVVRSEGDINQLVIEGGSSLKSYNNYDPHLIEQYDYPRIFLILNKQPEFRRLKYGYLKEIINQNNNLKNNFNEINDRYGRLFIYDTSDEVSAWQKRKMFQGFIDTIDNNLKIIEQELTFAQLAVNVINHSGQVTIEIIPDSLMPIGFDSFILELADGSRREVSDIINQKDILAEYSYDFDLLPTTVSFTLPMAIPVKSVNVRAKNLITGETVEGVYTGIASN